MARISPLLIAIDGRSGAGKTTLAADLAALLREHHTVGVFHLEDIYPGWDGLGDGVERYVDKVLGPLGTGVPAHWNAWDWETGRDGPPRVTPATQIVLLEGVGAAAAAARPHLDAVIWVEADAAVRQRTALERDGATYAPFWQRWADQESAWLGTDDPAGAADVVVQGHAGSSTARAVLRALAQLPAGAEFLAPHRAAEPGVTLDHERLPARPDPEPLFGTLYGASTPAVWLDSSDADTTNAGSRSRYSIMADAGGRFGRQALHTPGLTEITTGAVTIRVRGPFFRWLDDAWTPSPGVGEEITGPGYECGFHLGWLGHLGYELKRETGGADVRGPEGFPDAALLFAGRAVVLDHRDGAVHLLWLTDGDDDDRIAWAARVREAVAGSTPRAPLQPLPIPRFTARDTREEYLAKVRSAQAEIAEGNTYEACLTTSLSAYTERVAPLETYLHLRRASPAPFAHYLRFPGFAVASTSPERFLGLTAAGSLRAEPIKGTRGRSTDPAEDIALREDLRTSGKDRAENIMIVDLLRNDLSHHAVPGSVTVSRLCDIETYATVHQMVSTIDARLRPAAARGSVIASAFPAGSMTGAPKISTMAILDRLEQAPRGPYSGVAGYFSRSGAADLAVVIRTLVLQDDGGGGTRLTLGLGGAVTADSDPEEEWDEVRTKARGVLSALGALFPEDRREQPAAGAAPRSDAGPADRV
ncbi:aminodeoxychorismate synthase component I [Arthrobacter sp. RIT-PI-e]|uniref:aminodeoxychorismate synthase component I n=1 Tax=Arthrobacter sp. RIT-PI-e TaxID=1681197 RepID=UPI000A88E47B|nr:aminodeoxychorismate synthase component I [Arthrobacter sp. RIT-PI-e]